MNPTPCALIGRCGGCPWLYLPPAEQRERKRARFRERWKLANLPEAPIANLEIQDLGPGGLRERVDLALRNGPGQAPILGLWSTDHQELLTLPACPAMDPALEQGYLRLLADPPPLAKASLRLRIAPNGRFGLWIDTANTEIKTLLDEGAWLARAAQWLHLELGQRRKTWDPQRRLTNPQLLPWFSSFIGPNPDQLEPVDLYSVVGGFSQPGRRANRALIATLLRFLQAPRKAAAWPPLAGTHWVEFGAGSGNLSLPLAHWGAQLSAIEPDPLSAAGLERSAAAAGLSERIVLVPGSFQATGESTRQALAGKTGVLVDPPRSGIGALADVLADSREGPHELLYVSCEAESLIADLSRLHLGGWRVERLHGLDQFPGSPHAEWVCHAKRT